MTTEGTNRANRKVTSRLVVITLAMFGFGFALVPLYNLFCDITGLNGKTGQIEREQALTVSVDTSRWVTVEFVTSVNGQLAWEFESRVKKLRVHPGEIGEAMFYARNLTDRAVIAQAIPSLAPGRVAKYFNKTECFCFNQQKFGPGEAKEMPMRFVIDPNLPRDIKTVTLSYTFFDTDRTRANIKGKDLIVQSTM